MKWNDLPKSAVYLLITGLLFTSLTPIISRHLALPDFIKGFSTGLGIALEMIALVKFENHRKKRNCIKSAGTEL